jgi:hypothetical protein
MLPSLRLPQFAHAELGMLRTVSWLYAMYEELGKPNIDFIVERFETYSLDADGSNKKHVTNVQNLRTYFQHNLNPTSEGDVRTQDHCEGWFRTICAAPYPEEDEQWQYCLISLLTEARSFLHCVSECIQAISIDESRAEILRQWAFRRSRYHPQHEFDGIIAMVASDLGRDGIRPKNFSNRHYSRWLRELEVKENYDFDLEARKLVERAMLEDTQPQMPITGRDIMQEFSIGPGRRVGDLLKRAMDIYDGRPCSREELLQMLRQETLITALDGNKRTVENAPGPSPKNSSNRSDTKCP